MEIPKPQQPQKPKLACALANRNNGFLRKPANQKTLFSLNPLTEGKNKYVYMLFMCIQVYMSVYVCVYTYIDMYVCMCIYIYIYIHMCVYSIYI